MYEHLEGEKKHSKETRHAITASPCVSLRPRRTLLLKDSLCISVRLRQM